MRDCFPLYLKYIIYFLFLQFTQSVSFALLPTEGFGTAIYVHIPFCRRRCSYCDFTIVPIGGSQKQHQEQHGSEYEQSPLFPIYTTALISEIKSVALSRLSALPPPSLPPTPLRSVYFGGGTPSLLPPTTLCEILHTIRESFGVAEDAEITVECDPGTFDRRGMERLLEEGFNRVSLGVQSFDDVVLSNIGRFHRLSDVDASISILNSLNVSYSLDLISGLPGSTLESWEETVREAGRRRPGHISVYDLQVEEGTRFGRSYKRNGEEMEEDDEGEEEVIKDITGKLPPLPSPSTSASMYRLASNLLTTTYGYDHYEVSSYALPNLRSKHNSMYWDHGSSWVGVGVGATSCVRGRRTTRPRKMDDYVKWVEEGGWREEWEEGGGEREREGMIEDVILTRLRTKQGLDLDFMEEEYGVEVRDGILRGSEFAVDAGIAVVQEGVEEVGGTYLRLLDPDGFLFSNQVVAQIFYELGFASEE